MVFATIPPSPFHVPAIAALHRLSQAGNVSGICRQVLREYLAQLTRPGVLPAPISAAVAAKQVAALTSLYCVADETSRVTTELLALVGCGLAAGKHVHDANIAATCLAYGIPRLLTHDVSGFQRFASLLTIETI